MSMMGSDLGTKLRMASEYLSNESKHMSHKRSSQKSVSLIKLLYMLLVIIIFSVTFQSVGFALFVLMIGYLIYDARPFRYGIETDEDIRNNRFLRRFVRNLRDYYIIIIIVSLVLLAFMWGNLRNNNGMIQARLYALQLKIEHIISDNEISHPDVSLNPEMINMFDSYERIVIYKEPVGIYKIYEAKDTFLWYHGLYGSNGDRVDNEVRTAMFSLSGAIFLGYGVAVAVAIIRSRQKEML